MSPSASSGVGVAHLPNQRHKIVSKRGANFTLMVCGKSDIQGVPFLCITVPRNVCVFITRLGESGVGKTTFVNTLFTTGIKADKNLNKRHAKQIEKTVEIEITKAGNGEKEREMAMRV